MAYSFIPYTNITLRAPTHTVALSFSRRRTYMVFPEYIASVNPVYDGNFVSPAPQLHLLLLLGKFNLCHHMRDDAIMSLKIHFLSSFLRISSLSYIIT